MTRKTATAEKQPSLLDAAPQEAPAAKPIATTTKPAKKAAGTAVSTEVKPKQTRRQEIKNTAANTLAMLADALRDPNFNSEAMKMAFDLQERMVAEQARVDCINAFHEMKKELPIINKDGRIEIAAKDKPGGGKTTKQSTPFATYPNLRKICDPIISRHGFSMWDETEPAADGARINVIVHLDHNSGHCRQTKFPLPAETSGSKNNVQGWGSSFSFGRRYGAIGVLGLVTEAKEDQDRDGHAQPSRNSDEKDGQAAENGTPENESVPLITQAQEDQIRELLELKGKKAVDFCKGWKIDKLGSLEAEFFAQATDYLKKLPNV